MVSLLILLRSFQFRWIVALGIFYLAANIQLLFTSISKNSYQLSNVMYRKKRPFSVSPQDSCKVLIMSLRKKLETFASSLPIFKNTYTESLLRLQGPSHVVFIAYQGRNTIPVSCYNKNDGRAVASTVFLHSTSTSQIYSSRQFCC